MLISQGVREQTLHFRGAALIDQSGPIWLVRGKALTVTLFSREKGGVSDAGSWDLGDNMLLNKHALSFKIM